MSEKITELLEVMSESKRPDQRTTVSDKGKYPALRIISGIYRAVACVVAIGAGMLFFYSISLFQQGDEEIGAGLIISSLVFGIVGTITCLASSEILKLFIDLEGNTRKQIVLLDKLLDKK